MTFFAPFLLGTGEQMNSEQVTMNNEKIACLSLFIFNCSLFIRIDPHIITAPYGTADSRFRVPATGRQCLAPKAGDRHAAPPKEKRKGGHAKEK
jgi:hypothetical protein